VHISHLLRSGILKSRLNFCIIGRKSAFFVSHGTFFVIVILKNKLRNIRGKNAYDDFAISESAGLKFANNLEEE
jgi:hypothetical protein